MSSQHRPSLLVLLTMAVLALVPGCRNAEPTDSDQIRRDTYVVRGILTQLPEPKAEKPRIQVRHEAIPEFRGPGGKLGMNQMNMYFPLGEDADISGLNPGDVVELTFVVRFDIEADSPIGYHVTTIEALPPDTELDFNPRPDSPQSSDDAR